MHSSLLLHIVLCFVLFHCTLGQGCQGEVKLNPSTVTWDQEDVKRRIYTFVIKNTATCSFQGVGINIKVPVGARIVTSWGLGSSNNLINIFATLENGRSHQGAGFILSGEGDPSVTITSYEKCGCPTTGDTGGGLIPSDPGHMTSGDVDPHASTTGSTTGNQHHDGPYHYLGLKFVLLACTATDVRAAVARTTFMSVGSPFDEIIASSQGNASLNLKDSDGSGKYLAIISATEITLNCWNQDQIDEIQDYESEFNVKTVVMYSFPYAKNGMQLRGDGGLLTSGTQATFASDFLPSIPFFKQGTEIDISGVYSYPSTIASPSLATPAMYASIGGEQFVLGAFIEYPDGRRRLELYFDQGEFALYSVLIGAAWFQWASNGIFGGLRRIELNAHIDDIFMATGAFDPVTGAESNTSTYRITPADLLNIKNWQSSVNERLPLGSELVLTFPFNMATVMQKGGTAVDSLYLTAKSMRDEFFWESHTYSHLYLDNLTYQEVADEFNKNTDAVKDLFDNDLSNPNYCKLSVVTPSISGMYNGEALRAMWDIGIRNVVGDNSRPDLVPSNLYHGLYTTESYNGFPGIYIIPRHATNIYYFASTVQEIEEQFNLRYEATLGPYTFDQIVEKDVEVATKSLLSYRHDPFMFHQANMRTLTINGVEGDSLLGFWIDRVLDSVYKYSSLPIMSHTHDNLTQMYRQREERDACGFTGKIQVDTQSKRIVAMTATSTGACRYAVSGAEAEEKEGVENEVYGSERTIWLDLPGNTSVSVTFSSPVNNL